MAVVSPNYPVGSGAVKDGPFTLEFDLATWITDNGAFTSTNQVNLMTIPADTKVTIDQVEVITAFSLGSTGNRLDLGDSADDDEFVSNATSYAAGTNLTLLKNVGSSGSVYSAADQLLLKISGNAIASGKLRVYGTAYSSARNAPAVTFTP